MTDSSTVVEGNVKYRDGKKWKPRWCLVRKLSPVADCLTLQFYRDSKEKYKNGPTKSSLSLEKFLGVETSFTLDKESNTIALICSDLTIILAFDSRELLIQWQVKIKKNVVEVQQYLIQISHVPAKSKIPTGPARLHLRDYNFSLVASTPPRLLGSWQLEDLRRYGVIDSKFCFEGGSKCGRDEGLHILLSNEAVDISKAFDLASKGRLPGRRRPMSKAIDVTYNQRGMMKAAEACNSRDSERPLLWNCDSASNFDNISILGEDYQMHQCCGNSNQLLFLSPQSRESVAMSNDFASAHTSCVTLSEISSHCCSLLDKGDGDGSTVDRNSHIDADQYLVDRRLIVDRCPSCLGLTLGGSHTSDDFLDLSEDKVSTHTIIPTPISTIGNRPSDRDSIASGGSSSGSSDYNTPRNIGMNAMYDRPKRFSHLLNRCACKKKVIPMSPNSPMKSRQTFGNGEVSHRGNHFHHSDHASNKLRRDSCKTKLIDGECTLSNENLSVLNKCAQKCSCERLDKYDSLERHQKLKHRNDNLGASRSSSPCKVRAAKDIVHVHQGLTKNEALIKTQDGFYGCGCASKFTGYPSMSNKAVACQHQSHCSICTCHQRFTKLTSGGAYSNYDVPHAVINNKDLKSGKANTSNRHVQLYDVPKQVCKHDMKATAMQCKEIGKVKVVSESICDDDKLWKQQQNDCACQKMMLWAENWFPCRRKYVEDSIPFCNSLGRKTGGLKKMTKYRCLCQADDVQITNISTQQENRHNHPKDDSSGSEKSRVSINSRESGYQSSESKETDNDSDIVKDTIGDKGTENYANIDFIDSLPLYENTSKVLMNAGISGARGEEDKLNYLDKSSEDRPELPTKSPALSKRLPPLPPRFSKPSATICSNCCKDELVQCKEVKGKESEKKSTVCNESQNTDSNEADDDNYLEMQPVMMASVTDEAHYLTMCDIHKSLPLRPFMPYEISHKANDKCSEVAKMPMEKTASSSERGNVATESCNGTRPSLGRDIVHRMIHSKSVRSNSLAEIKRNTMPKKRSNSVDSLDDHCLDDNNEAREKTDLSPARQYLISKMARSKIKCKSHDELSSYCSPPIDRGHQHFSLEYLDNVFGLDENFDEETTRVPRAKNCKSSHRRQFLVQCCDKSGIQSFFPLKRSSSVPDTDFFSECKYSMCESTSDARSNQFKNYMCMDKYQSLPRPSTKKLLHHKNHQIELESSKNQFQSVEH